MYALATTPLISQLQAYNNGTQVWYADDAAAAGGLQDLLQWWSHLATLGPEFGYFANAPKTWLLTKHHLVSEARNIFQGTQVNVTSVGRPYLGSPLGPKPFVEQFVSEKVVEWLEELDHLIEVARIQPHAAFAAFTHSFIHKLSFLCRCTEDIAHLLHPIEDKIHFSFIPVLTGQAPPNDTVRQLLSLPPKLGGLGLCNPTTLPNVEYSASKAISVPLSELIIQKFPTYSANVQEQQIEAKASAVRSRHESTMFDLATVKEQLPNPLRYSVELAQEKGVSSWLSVLPLEEFGFSLHKGAFRDALALRYGWNPSLTPTTCDCGATFSVEHVLFCTKGGFPILRHNKVRDTTASLLTDVCHDVQIEPELQPLTGETFPLCSANTDDGARLDIVASWFWGGRFERTFFDVRVFNPHARSNRQQSLPATFRRHEREKQRRY